MNSEDLREKVKDDAILKIHQGWSSDQIADAAIRVVLETALEPIEELEKACRKESGDETAIYSIIWTGMAVSIKELAQDIRALLPQDKDTGSSAPVANRRD